MDLCWIPDHLAVARLSTGSSIPEAANSQILCLLQTQGETTLVCEWSSVAPDHEAAGPWRAFRVVGRLEFWQTGILAALAAPLADAQISLFALSTYETDYLLVPSDRALDAAIRLREAGHALDDPS